jgi:hypothetical protein
MEIYKFLFLIKIFYFLTGTETIQFELKLVLFAI